MGSVCSRGTHAASAPPAGTGVSAAAAAADTDADVAAQGAARDFLMPLGLEVYVRAFELAGVDSAYALENLDVAVLTHIEARSRIPILPPHRAVLLAAAAQAIAQGQGGHSRSDSRQQPGAPSLPTSELSASTLEGCSNDGGAVANPGKAQASSPSAAAVDHHQEGSEAAGDGVTPSGRPPCGQSVNPSPQMVTAALQCTDAPHGRRLLRALRRHNAVPCYSPLTGKRCSGTSSVRIALLRSLISRDGDDDDDHHQQQQQKKQQQPKQQQPKQQQPKEEQKHKVVCEGESMPGPLTAHHPHLPTRNSSSAGGGAGCSSRTCTKRPLSSGGAAVATKRPAAPHVCDAVHLQVVLQSCAATAPPIAPLRRSLARSSSGGGAGRGSCLLAGSVQHHIASAPWTSPRRQSGDPAPHAAATAAAAAPVSVPSTAMPAVPGHHQPSTAMLAVPGHHQPSTAMLAVPGHHQPPQPQPAAHLSQLSQPQSLPGLLLDKQIKKQDQPTTATPTSAHIMHMAPASCVGILLQQPAQELRDLSMHSLPACAAHGGGQQRQDSQQAAAMCLLLVKELSSCSLAPSRTPDVPLVPLSDQLQVQEWECTSGKQEKELQNQEEQEQELQQPQQQKPQQQKPQQPTWVVGGVVSGRHASSRAPCSRTMTWPAANAVALGSYSTGARDVWRVVERAKRQRAAAAAAQLAAGHIGSTAIIGAGSVERALRLLQEYRQIADLEAAVHARMHACKN
jgi:hypothetical protein